MSIVIDPLQTDPREKTLTTETENVGNENLSDDTTEGQEEDDMNDEVDEEMAEDDE